MTDVLIFNTQGEVSDTFTINDSLEFVNGRVSKGDKHYYKGSGVSYSAHFIPELKSGYDLIAKSDVFYLGYEVVKQAYKGKTGIFPERYQPHFTDWIGACGVKELQIIENLWELGFDRTAIDVHHWDTISEEHQQYCLAVDYPYGRDTYLTNPKPSELAEMLQHMLSTDWNFPWDKDAITDITPNGRVTDVADIFQSTELKHKFGSIYSVLYSMGMGNRGDYEDFCNHLGLPSHSNMTYVFNTISILSMGGVDTRPLIEGAHTDTYVNSVLNYLVVGKNCGYCGVGSCKNKTDDNQSYGDMILEDHYNRARASLTGV